METNNKLSKSGKALLFITSGLLLSDPCFGAPRIKWTAEEDARLIQLVQAALYDPTKQHQFGKYVGQPNWVVIATHVPNKTAKQCQNHWTRSLDPTINKDPWTVDEDDQLTQLVEKHDKKWAVIAALLGENGEGKYRTDTQCRQRWNRLKKRD
jgi:hypothetical protein